MSSGSALDAQRPDLAVRNAVVQNTLTVNGHLQARTATVQHLDVAGDLTVNGTLEAQQEIVQDLLITDTLTVAHNPTVGHVLTCVNADGEAAWAPGGGGGGISQVDTGAGLTGGPITTTGTISVANAGITNAMLQNPSLTVAAGAGLSGGGLVPLGGSTSLALPAVAGNVGSFTSANVTVDTFGRVTAASNGAAGVTGSGTADTFPIWTGANTLGDSGTIFKIGTTTWISGPTELTLATPGQLSLRGTTASSVTPGPNVTVLGSSVVNNMAGLINLSLANTPNRYGFTVVAGSSVDKPLIFVTPLPMDNGAASAPTEWGVVDVTGTNFSVVFTSTVASVSWSYMRVNLRL